jgi:hypothetical protein
LAEKSGASRQWIVEVEQGKAALPFGLLMQVLDALGLVFRVMDGTAVRMAGNGGVGRAPEIVARDHRIVGRSIRQQSASKGAPSRSDRQAEPHREVSKNLSGLSYQPTDFEAFATDLNKEKLYQSDYREAIRRMVAHVIRLEGPIFEELVAPRIARAHGLARATEKLQQIVLELTGPTFGRSLDGERTVIWPDAHSKEMSPFRYASQDVRKHEDIPLAELASLAASVSVPGQAIARTAELMRRELGLKSMGKDKRSRFEAAAELARRLSVG